MTRVLTVLITGAGAVTCQSVIKGLRGQPELNVRLITVDMQTNVAGRFFSDAFYQVPAARDEVFIPTLLNICEQEAVDLLIPSTDYELAKLALHKPDFEKIRCTVVISPPEVIEKCNDKWKTFQFFKQNKIPTPKTYLPNKLPAELIFPLFIKPRRMGHGSKDAHRVDDKAELTYLLKRIEEPIMQQALEGIEFTIDVLCDFDGRALNAVPRERIDTRSGVSYKGRTVRDEELIFSGVNIAEKLGIIGPCNIQCFKNDLGLFFFEINPRYSGTLPLTLAAGFNSPAVLAQMRLGRRFKPFIGEFEEGVYMMRYWQEVFVDQSGMIKNSFTAMGLK
ncbi:ATP-grasp domain-containing protein [Nitrospinae bacterium AH_259_B05_G02_I21]|nr:ATP-grasp domain-containing protein [Nitrospinae bacterium AH_259_B05_G02_I21]